MNTRSPAVPFFAINEYDRDGDVVNRGVSLIFGPATIWISTDLDGFDTFIERLRGMREEIVENYRDLPGVIDERGKDASVAQHKFMPGHPEPRVFAWSAMETRAIAKALEEAQNDAYAEGRKDATEESAKRLQPALDALDEIALAGMSGTGQESEEGMREWHARQAWKFISIAAQARLAIQTMGPAA